MGGRRGHRLEGSPLGGGSQFITQTKAHLGGLRMLGLQAYSPLNFSECRASQHQASNTPLPTLSLPPPFGARQSQIQTAPNFDSFVTTVPARLSQAVQTEAIYRCVGDTDTHTMTHTQDPRLASAEPWTQKPGHKWSPDPQRDAHTQKRYPDPDTEGPRDQEGSGTHSWGSQTQRGKPRPRQRHTVTAHSTDGTETHSHRPRPTAPRTLQTHTRSSRHRAGQTVSHTPDSPPPPPPSQS